MTTSETSQLREALKRALNDLRAYGYHLDGELVARRTDPDHRPVGEPCKCGLDDAIAGAASSLGYSPQSYREERSLARLTEPVR